MTVMPYAEFMKFVFRNDPALRGPVRSAFTGHVDTSDWQPGWAWNRMPSKLESHLRTSTAQVLAELLRTQKGYAVVVDDTQPCAAMYALSTKAVSNMVKMVGQMVETGSIDRPSELLFLSFLRRHDHYVSALGESIPEELKLGYGPSMLYPSSNCLFAYREDNPDVRLDVGQDQSFANALKAPPDQTVASNAKRRLSAAIREATMPVRAQAKLNDEPVCVGCKAPLTELRFAQGLGPIRNRGQRGG
jgi:hypothetical protein